MCYVFSCPPTVSVHLSSIGLVTAVASPYLEIGIRRDRGPSVSDLTRAQSCGGYPYESLILARLNKAQLGSKHIHSRTTRHTLRHEGASRSLARHASCTDNASFVGSIEKALACCLKKPSALLVLERLLKKNEKRVRVPPPYV